MSQPSTAYYQYPPPFDLPDEAVVAGRHFSGHRARVYHLLRITRERRYRHRVGRHLAPAGKVPVFLFREPWSGGQSGGRRVRELRDYGLEVDISTFVDPDGDASATTLYELLETLPLTTAASRPTEETSLPAQPVATLSYRPRPGTIDLTPRPPTPGTTAPLVPDWTTVGAEDYRIQLNAAAGRLGAAGIRSSLAGGQVFVAGPTCLEELGWDPLPVLAQFLRALGVVVVLEDER